MQLRVVYCLFLMLFWDDAPAPRDCPYAFRGWVTCHPGVTLAVTLTVTLAVTLAVTLTVTLAVTLAVTLVGSRSASRWVTLGDVYNTQMSGQTAVNQADIFHTLTLALA